MIGTEVAAEIISIADANATANRPAVSRADEKKAKIGKILCDACAINIDPRAIDYARGTLANKVPEVSPAKSDLRHAKGGSRRRSCGAVDGAFELFIVLHQVAGPRRPRQRGRYPRSPLGGTQSAAGLLVIDA